MSSTEHDALPYPVRETGKPIAEVARSLGINAGTVSNWVNAGKRHRGDGSGVLDEDERAELARLRRQNAELPGHHWQAALAIVGGAAASGQAEHDVRLVKHVSSS